MGIATKFRTNEKQVELIKKGPAIWNQWRLENPDQKIQLSYANLSGLKLSNVNSPVNLLNAELHGADLSGTELYRAILANADLSNANLTNSILSGAEMHGANLT